MSYAGKQKIAKRFRYFLAHSAQHNAGRHKRAFTHSPLVPWAIGLTLCSRQHFNFCTHRGWSIFLPRIIHSAAYLLREFLTIFRVDIRNKTSLAAALYGDHLGAFCHLNDGAGFTAEIHGISDGQRFSTSHYVNLLIADKSQEQRDHTGDHQAQDHHCPEEKADIQNADAHSMPLFIENHPNRGDKSGEAERTEV